MLTQGSFHLLLLLCLLQTGLCVPHRNDKRETIFSGAVRACDDSCKFTTVETIPEDLIFKSESRTYLSTYDAWTHLLKISTHNIKIASFYWHLTVNASSHPSSKQGQSIYDGLLEAARKRSIDIQIAQNAPSKKFPNLDSAKLAEEKSVKLRNLNMKRFGKNGVLHTKFWIVDSKHAYIGSANMDWRSLTQVKEVGLLIENCSCIAKDLEKIFEVYWTMSDDSASSIPTTWPGHLSTSINLTNPAAISLDGTEALTYIASSPPYFSPVGRTNDLEAILNIINNAKKFVHVAVMNFVPQNFYSKPKRFWAVLDNALRRAAIDRRVRVRLLLSKWNYTKPVTWNFAKSLAALNSTYISIEVKAFKVPSFTDEQRQLPHARVNHAKMMVTEQTAYIGTSNWEPNYFIDTTGVGLVINQSSNDSIRGDLTAIFERDWNSEFAEYVTLDFT
ncbi:5'-3' exonuclease PLD3-like [Haemaphysalis longicornis]